MRNRVFLALALYCLLSTTATAQSTAFTYQGKLVDNGNLANTSYDMQFKLFDALSGGTQIGATLTFDGSGTNPPAVAVMNGLFAVTLDFGTCPPPFPCFDGNSRYLEIAVRVHGVGSYVTLTPRQQITSTPYSIKTQNLTFNGPFNDGTTVFTASNTFAGEGAGLNTTPNSALIDVRGKFNAFFGAGAGQANTTGANNAFFGTNAGKANTTGVNNAFFGFQAGISNTAGNSNTFVGIQAGNLNTTGAENAFFGYRTGFNNTTGNLNAFFGSGAGQANTTGNVNAFFGSGAGNFNTTGANNAFFGYRTGEHNSIGSGNVFIGTNADFIDFNASGNNNTLLGSSAKINSSIDNATAIGASASVTQSNSLVLGNNANVGIGTTAPAERLHVVGNGLFTGNLTVNGTLNAGSIAASSVTGVVATANGGTGLNSSGAAGNYLRSNGSTWTSAAIQAADLPSGSTNYIQNQIEGQSGNFNIFGSGVVGENFFVGNNVAVIGRVGIGINYADSFYKLHIESDFNFGLRVQTNTSGGAVASFGGNGDFLIDANGIEGGRFIVKEDGNVGIGTAAPDQKLSVNGNASKIGGGSWAVFSDERLKEIHGRYTRGLQAVLQLQPIRFEYKPDNTLGLHGSGEYIGFSAQAVAGIVPEAVTRSASGYLQINNDPILWTMLNAVKEQQAQIQQQQEQLRERERQAAAQQSRLTQYESQLRRQQQELAALKQVVCASRPRAEGCRAMRRKE